MIVKPQVVHLCFSDLTLSVARAPAHEESSLEMHVLHKQTRRSQGRRAGPMTGPPRLTLLRGGQHSATLAETAGDFNAAVLTVSCPTCNRTFIKLVRTGAPDFGERVGEVVG
jgi:hypothetical protein